MIFSFQLSDRHDAEYRGTLARLHTIAEQHPGFISETAIVSATGEGLSVSYWRSRESIEEWSRQTDHAAASNKAALIGTIGTNCKS
ncbi:MAG: hypothetical protein HC850_12900 [Rhodomicrobium sp.]|nr:hypothetical protein [Rhodomicrobium sp.]